MVSPFRDHSVMPIILPKTAIRTLPTTTGAVGGVYERR